MRYKKIFILLFLVTILLFFVNLSLGSVAIPIKEIFKIFSLEGSSKAAWDYIVLSYRLPKAMVEVLVGMGLSLSGLLMQTLFRNPLAGPYVLGISSGASVGVAYVVFGSAFLQVLLSDFFLSDYGIIIALSLVSFVVLLAVMSVAERLKDAMVILVVGLLFGSVP